MLICAKAPWAVFTNNVVDWFDVRSDAREFARGSGGVVRNGNGGLVDAPETYHGPVIVPTSADGIRHLNGENVF